MNKWLLAVVVLSTGAVGAGLLHRATDQAQSQRAQLRAARDTATNELTELTVTVQLLRDEVVNKKNRLVELQPPSKLHSDLARLLDGEPGNSAAWTELRDQLGIGWDSSKDFVLVSKRVLKQLNYQRLQFGRNGRASNTAAAILGISAEEQSGIQAVLQQAASAQWLQVQRAEPSGDIVAQYTCSPPDRAQELSISNAFNAGITSVLGPERAALFAEQGWREVRRDLAGSEPAVLTVRRSQRDGEPDLVYELKEGKSAISNPVRYAHYPSGWFLTLFPGGWQTLADREGFELPPNFKNPNAQ